MLRNKVFIYLLLLSSLSGAKYLAVLDLEPEGLSASEAKILTQRLTSKIIELGKYTVVERANIDKILAEMKFQTTSGCVNSECAVEIGQMAGAEVTVIGTVSKFGDTYTIDARIIDVESGSALESASFTHTGKIDELVKDGIESIAHKLLGITFKKKGTTSKASSGYGATLDISSDPPGAEVYIGGNYFDTTPIILEDFPAGDYEVALKLAGYEDYTKSVKLHPRGSKTIFTTFTSIPAHIKIRGTPTLDEVKVFVDGKERYLNYSQNKVEVSAGKHIIKVSKENYFDFLDTVLVDFDKTVEVSYKLKKNMGHLSVKVKPTDAKIYIDDLLKSKYTELSSGTHILKVYQSGYDDYTGEFEIKLDETTELSIELIEQIGHLDLKLKPYNAKVYFNDSLAMELELPSSIVFDNNTVEFKLRSGTYDVRAEKPFYYSKSLPAIIKNKERTDLTLTLEPKNRSEAKKRAWRFPGLGHMYADKQSKGIVLMALEAATLLGAFTMTADYLSVADAYKTAEADYLAATDQNEIQRTKDIYENLSKDKTQKLIGSAGLGTAALAVWIWNVYDLNKSLPSQLDLSMNSKGQLEASIAF